MPGTPTSPRRFLVAALSTAALAACAPQDAAERDTTAAGGAYATPPAEPADTGAPVTVAPAACAGDGLVVTGERAGAVRLGMTAASLRELCATRDTTVDVGEGMREPALALRVGEAPVVAFLAGDSVSRIRVAGAGLATERGIEVGSDLGTLRARYAGVCTLVGEGRILVASNELAGVSFDTSADFGAFSSSGTDALPDSVQVTGILVHGVQQVCAGG